MRSLLLLALLAAAPVARAQDDAETRWLVAETASDRFGDGSFEGPTFREGNLVTVLFTEGDKVRVFRGTRFGWVPATALTDVAPPSAVAPTPAPIAMPAGEFNLGALEALLKGSKTE